MCVRPGRMLHARPAVTLLSYSGNTTKPLGALPPLSAPRRAQPGLLKVKEMREREKEGGRERGGR